MTKCPPFLNYFLSLPSSMKNTKFTLGQNPSRTRNHYYILSKENLSPTTWYFDFPLMKTIRKHVSGKLSCLCILRLQLILMPITLRNPSRARFWYHPVVSKFLQCGLMRTYCRHDQASQVEQTDWTRVCAHRKLYDFVNSEMGMRNIAFRKCSGYI